MVIGPGCAKARQCIVPKTGKRSRPVWAALTPAFPPVLSPGFEPGLDASLAHCLYRLGYESMRRQSAGICPRSPLWIRPLVPNPALMLAVDAHTATRGMTGITGYDAHAPPRPFPHHVDRLTRGVIDYDSGNPVRTWRMGRSDSRRPFRRRAVRIILE